MLNKQLQEVSDKYVEKAADLLGPIITRDRIKPLIELIREAVEAGAQTALQSTEKKDN